MGEFIAVSVFDMVAGEIATSVVAFAINMVISSVISTVFAPDAPNQGTQQAQPNPGNRQQAPPAGDNKLPVVYGSAYCGGVITDMSISSDNQDIYWVMSLCEVTNTETGGTPDLFTFGDIYWGGKKAVFDATTKYKVIGLLDQSTGETQDITDYMDIYLYRNGSSQPVNGGPNAITVMSADNLIYKWDSTKLMSNCVFAIVHMKYSQSRNLVSLNQTRFQVINSRNEPGNCILDYLTSERYGAAIPMAQIDTTSLNALNTYSNETFSYYSPTGAPLTQKRFQFNGSLQTTQKIMQNIQSMSNCCDCLIRYNEITSKWGVIVQSPTYSIAMDIDNTNTIGGITVTPIDVSNTFNVIECKFPDGSEKDSFNSSTFDLAEIDPSLLFANEPVNKQSVNLYLTNNAVTAQYLAIRMLKASREDLQIQIEITYIGLELEAGDIVALTNTNYGWTSKLFRVTKITQKISDTAAITNQLFLSEYNPDVYDDYPITDFTPSPNTGIGSPTTFGTVYAPQILTQYPNTASPSFLVTVQASSNGISEYAEIWYSAYQYPSDAQRIFAGTTQIQPDGSPYLPNAYMPDVSLAGIPAGDWYFFARMVNNLASSNYSLASSVFKWRPTTFQYSDKYLAVAYADNITGTSNFNLNPRNRLYYGLSNQSGTTISTTPSDYTWFLADPTFSTNKFLAYSNRTGRKFSFATDNAAYAAGTASFVPTTSAYYDPSIWSALADGINLIDLDMRTGQLIGTGTTTVSTGEIAITNTVDGQVVAALQQFLDFGGPSTFTGSASTLTIDIYGRVVGFSAADSFYMTISQFVATASQTVFSVTRDASYIVGQCLVFKNGILLSESDYTDASGSVTLGTGATVGANITVISMRAISTSAYYDLMSMSVLSVASNVVTWNGANMPWDLIDVGNIVTFSNTGTPTQYTVTGVNYSTREITFSASVTSVSAGDRIYFYRAATSSYRVFSRYTTNQTNASNYTPTLWAFASGYELPFINGSAITAYDYNLTSNTYSSIPNLFSGDLDIIQFTGNNLTTPTGSMVNMLAYTVIGQAGYSFTSIANALNVYANGALLVNGTDYTSTTTSYTLTVTPANNTTIMAQQTFARYGAA